MAALRISSRQLQLLRAHSLSRPSVRTPLHCRFASSQPPSIHANFYKTFGRPIAKVFLMAVFTYQLTYWAWAKLEQDEIRAERQAELSGLEEQVKTLQERGTAKSP